MASIQAVRERLAARRFSQTYTKLTGVQPTTAAALLAQREEMLKRISGHRLFTPPQQPFQLTGVLGDSAIFNGAQLVKVGQMAGEMKVLSIGPNWVEVETKGQTQKMYVFQPMPSGPSGMPGMPGMPGGPRGRPMPGSVGPE